MQTSFLSIFNKSGIACASSEDHTLYQLSKEEPVVVAVDPNSPIPWESLIDGYKRLGEPKKHSELEGYAKDFEEYISAQMSILCVRCLPRNLKMHTILRALKYRPKINTFSQKEIAL